MSIFKKKLGILTDVRPVADPLGVGVTFHIRSKRHPAYKAFVAELAKHNKFGQALQAELSREQTQAAIAGRKVNKAAAIDRAFDKCGDAFGNSADFIAENIRRVAHLLDGWEGEDTEFSVDAAVELLSLENPLPPGTPYREKEIPLDADELAAEKENAASESREPKTARTVVRNLGEALMAFIEEEADKEDLYVEGLAKNSQASSAGAPDSSAD